MLCQRTFALYPEKEAEGKDLPPEKGVMRKCSALRKIKPHLTYHCNTPNLLVLGVRCLSTGVPHSSHVPVTQDLTHGRLRVFLLLSTTRYTLAAPKTKATQEDT